MSGINLTLPGNNGIGIGGTQSSIEAVISMGESERNRYDALSAEEREKVDSFAKGINMRSENLATEYGLGAQRNLSNFTDKTLQHVAGKDIGDIGELLTQMSIEIRTFNSDFEKEIGGKAHGIFRKAKKNFAESKERVTVKYNSVLATLEKIASDLQARSDDLKRDQAMLDKMYESNLDYFKELNMYIIAGRKALEDAMNGELQELRRKAETTGLPEDAQACNDYQKACISFDKRLYDLELTRSICLQSAPEIRTIQGMDEDTIQKITSMINNAIPLWKQSIAIGLALERNARATQANQVVYDLTSEMLKANMDKLHLNGVESAKMSEKGFIDVKAVEYCNAQLIQTIQDMNRIHAEGYKQRETERKTLYKLENDLKMALLKPVEGPTSLVS